MSRTVTALYDTRAEAEAARDRLATAVDVEGRAQIIDKSSAGGSGQASGQAGGQGSASSSLHRMPLSNEDRHAYGEGIRRGGFMLCAEVDEDADADKIVRVLEETSSVDLDERQKSWRNEGWAGYSPSTAGAASIAGTPRASTGSSGTGLAGSQHGSGREVAEEHIPIVEEELVVGKREVNRGGARVRSYVREVPVHEQVTLREEHVDVERRPVSGERIDPARAAEMMQDRTIEMTETAEEAVVAKEARVREEVVVRKSVDQRTEQIDDTVRHTEVEVDENRDGGAFKFDGSRDNDGGNRR